MTTQIRLQLPSDLVAWLDEQVAASTDSRSALVTKALHRYRRHLNAEHDAEIYQRTGDYPDLEGMHDRPRHTDLD